MLSSEQHSFKDCVVAFYIVFFKRLPFFTILPLPIGIYKLKVHRRCITTGTFDLTKISRPKKKFSPPELLRETGAVSVSAAPPTRTPTAVLLGRVVRL